MGSYCYIKDKNEEFGFTPIPEDEYLQAIFRIVKKNDLKITDEMILKEIESLNKI